MIHRTRITAWLFILTAFLTGCTLSTATSATLTTATQPSTETTTTTTVTATSSATETTTTTTKTDETTTIPTAIVQFDLQGGAFTQTTVLAFVGELLPLPQTPIKVDHRFLGWYLDPEGTAPWDVLGQLVTSDLTLYAKWEAITLDDTVVEPGETYRETFTNLTQSSSSYTTFTYDGVQATTWQFVGARGDTALDGKAVMLGGAIDLSKIQVVLPGGLDRLSFQVLKAFTNTNERKLEIKLNGTSYGMFDVDAQSTQAQTITLENIALLGDVTLEILHVSGAEARAQILIDNLEWTTYSGSSVPIEQRRIALDKETLSLPAAFEEATRWILPSFGTYGSQIIWSFSDPQSINNDLVDLAGGRFLMPGSGVQTVELRATLSLGSYVEERLFAVKLGVAEPLSLEAAAEATLGASVRTRGIVVSIIMDGDIAILHLQDGFSGLKVEMAAAMAQGIEIGDELVVKGFRHEQNGMPYLTQISAVDNLGKAALPDVVTVDNPQQLSQLLAQSVRLTGLLAQNVAQYATEARIATGNGMFTVRWTDGQSAAVLELLASSIAGADIEVVGTVIRNQSVHYLLITDVRTLTAGGSVDVEAAAAILSALYGVELPTQTTSDLAFPSAANLPFYAQVDWVSSHPSVIDATGKVVSQTADVDVTLTYKIRLGATVVFSDTRTVTVRAASGYAGYYASLTGLSGDALKTELARIISTGVKTISYSATSYVLDETDADPAKPGNILLVYNRASVSGVWDGATTWNKEHVWPQSKLGTASDSDLHNLKPSNPTINSSRGNLPFVAGTGAYGVRGSGWFPGEDDKGDIARIVFYMNTRWGLAINSGIGSLSTFIQWHNEDPVDDFERSRNESIYANQNNRNPYIDHPELVALVYGTSNQNGLPAQTTVWMLFVDWRTIRDERRYAEPSTPLA
jgi:endonuclease I